MIDRHFLREHADLVAENNRRRGKEIDVQVAVGLIDKRLDILGKTEQRRAQANEVAKRIGAASPADREPLKEEGKRLKEEVKGLEAQLAVLDQDLAAEMRKYPNMLQADVPEGMDEKDNLELREVGRPTEFSFEPKDHMALGTALGIIDNERAAKVSGSRFTYLKGDLVLLQMAIVHYTLSTLVKEGFVPIIPPHIISRESMAGMGYLDHGGEEEIYHLKNDDAVLIGTSEQAIGPMFKDETLDGALMPMRFVGYSPCYRREAGSFGKDVGGILRLHQFDKIEMFSFTRPEQSNPEHEFLLSMEEKLMQGLGLPYRVLKLCSRDTGTPSSRTYDIETWIPSQKKYRETHSTSNTTDFQTRRLNIRYKSGKEKGYAHALNGTAFALGRIMIAILENNQREDGSVVVPEVLRALAGKDVMGKKL
ncbi:serine--tRNA ligase [Candidatus Uhrbacteria bacterium]|nr:serine--tRNA ligase [Candidatus Uhrbacteria bacterium]